MAYSRHNLNFKTSSSGLLVPTIADNSGLDAVDVSYDIDLPGGTTNYLREDGTWADPTTGGGGATITTGTTDPGSPSAGDAWLNTDSGVFSIYDGTQWRRFRSLPDEFALGYRAAVLSAVPILYYTFDEGSVGVVIDYSSNGFPASPSGTITFGATGKVGLAATFNNGKVSPSNTTIDILGDITCEAWIKTSDTTHYQSIISKPLASAGVAGYEFRVDATTGYLHVLKTATAGLLTGVTAVHDGAWHHVAFTRSGNTFTTYVDGAVDATGTNSTAVNSAVGAWQIGNSSGSEYFIGTIDEVAIYSRALASAEIAAHYAAA